MGFIKVKMTSLVELLRRGKRNVKIGGIGLIIGLSCLCYTDYELFKAINLSLTTPQSSYVDARITKYKERSRVFLGSGLFLGVVSLYLLVKGSNQQKRVEDILTQEQKQENLNINIHCSY